MAGISNVCQGKQAKFCKKQKSIIRDIFFSFFFLIFIEDYSQHNKITYSTIISKTNNYYYKLPTILLFTNSDPLFTILALMEKGKEN